MAHDHQKSTENKNTSIRYEEKDTDNRSIVILGAIILGIILTISLAMIPLTRHLWNQAGEKAVPGNAVPMAASPETVLEVTPGAELAKLHAEIKANDYERKIDQAMKEALKKGFPAREQ